MNLELWPLLFLFSGMNSIIYQMTILLHSVLYNLFLKKYIKKNELYQQKYLSKKPNCSMQLFITYLFIHYLFIDAFIF